MNAEQTLGDIKLMLNKLDSNVEEEAKGIEDVLKSPDEHGNISLEKHSDQIKSMLAQAS